jgi:hypothetical protein
MGKLAEPGRGTGPHATRGRLSQLRDRRRKLSAQVAKLDKQIARLTPAKSQKPIDSAAIDRWLDELSQGLGELPPLPADFSRADLYDDHD